MTVQNIAISLQDDEGRIDLNSEVTEELAQALDRGLEKLFAYYHYQRVVLRINSPGGRLLALEHILECIGTWRARGHEIHTEATFCAGSAAALLLAQGEVGSRSVHRHTSVLFHHTRVDGAASAITAGRANHLASMLTRTDHGRVKRVAEHAIAGYEGFETLCRVGQQRCDILRTNFGAIAESLGCPVDRRHPRWLTAIHKLYAQGQATDNTAAYQRYLEKRFDQDTFMDLREAYALNLLDNVRGVAYFDLSPTKGPARAPERHQHLHLAA